jgi:hypothetical protein
MLPLGVYIAVSECRVRMGQRPLSGEWTRHRWFWITVVGIIAAFFVLRNLPWAPFSLLAPPG